MKLDTFLDHLDRYGPDIDRWPAEVRASGRELSVSSAEAAAAVASARQLAALLGDLPARRAPAYLAARIAARAGADRDLWGRLGDWFGTTLWRPALAASLALALGFVLGFSYPQPAATDDAYLLESVGMLPFSERFEELPYEE